MKIIADASIPGLNKAFFEPFELSYYSNQNELKSLLKDNEILICRSTLKVDNNFLENSSIRMVATASSGSDHFNKEELKQAGIQWFAARGSNAVAVADYVISVLAWFSIFQKRHFKRVGIIGMGKVGQSVFNRFKDLGLEPVCYDPLREKEDIEFISARIEDLFDCDLISIHANLHDDPVFGSRNLINQSILEKLAPSSVILNAARGGIVTEADISAHKEIIYCTDVYENEPEPSKEIINFASLCTPHIAGHSIEAKLNATRMISEQIHEAFNLPSPDFNELYPKVVQRPFEKEHWEDWVLSIYNPAVDTEKLKHAEDLKSCFQTLRKAHQFRHDFSAY